MKYEIPQMIKNGAGVMVNMSSGAGVIRILQTPVYVASKHAVLGLTKSAAIGYAKSGIRINAVAPGLVKTNMISSVDKQFMETLKSMHPIGRIADPEEIANAVVWLLSDKASFVLGHTMLVDGGKRLPLLQVAQVAWDLKFPLSWQEMDFILTQQCVT
jgi:NAD(P)-dependent dehydrogenase (short-subunit alcohol dehydrogenase family)